MCSAEISVSAMASEIGWNELVREDVGLERADQEGSDGGFAECAKAQ